MTNLLPVLPPAAQYGFSIHRKPTTSALVATAVTGREVTSARQAFPLWEFELTYEFLRDRTQNQTPDTQYNLFGEYTELLTLFLVDGGQAEDFYFDDLSDNSRSGQPIGVGDGASTQFPIVRTIGTGDLAFAEPVGGIDVDSTITVYINGTPTAAYTISADQQYIIFTSAPAAAAVLTSDFAYFYRCRFLEDVIDFEQFMHDLWLMKSLKFRSVKYGVTFPPV